MIHFSSLLLSFSVALFDIGLSKVRSLLLYISKLLFGDSIAWFLPSPIAYNMPFYSVLGITMLKFYVVLAAGEVDFLDRFLLFFLFFFSSSY